MNRETERSQTKSLRYWEITKTDSHSPNHETDTELPHL